MSDLEFKLRADVESAKSGVAGFRKEYVELVKTVEKPLRQVGTLVELQTQAKGTAAEFFAAKRKVDDLQKAMSASTQPARALQRELAAAERTMESSKRRLDQQTAALKAQRQELQAAGVDTRNLAAEQARLQRELAASTARGGQDSQIQNALKGLGVAQAREARAEIAQLQRQYELLRRSGSATANELALAQNTLKQRIAETERQTQSLTRANGDWTRSLSLVKAEILAGAASFGTLTVAASRGFDKFAAFSQQMAGVQTITNLTGDQLDQMGQQVRQLSLSMGTDAVNSASALLDILGSGVSDQNAMSVLTLATKAAIAGMTETKTAASTGVTVINAYGESVDKLGLRYDQLFLAIQDGVTTFPELADGLGQILPIAAAAGVKFDEVAAAIARMTVQGIRTPIATNALRGAITALAAPAPEAKKAMQALGIEWKGLTNTLQQIANAKLGYAALQSIIPDVEARTAVAALTKDIGGLQAEVGKMANAAGATERAYNIMKDTPQHQMEAFKAAVGELQLALGQAVAAGLPIINMLTDMLNAFNQLPQPVRATITGIVALGASAAAAALLIRALRAPFAMFLSQLVATPAAAAAAGTSLDVLTGKAGKLSTAFGALSKVGNLTRLGGYGIIAGQLAELYDLYQQNQELVQSQEDYRKSLAATVQANEPYRNTLILTAQEQQALTVTEKAAYAERLKAAQTYYSKLSEQISRNDFEKNGPTAAVSPEALAAAKQASAYRKASDAIAQALSDRQAKETAFNTSLKTIKSNELRTVQANLAAQLTAYEKANAALKKSQDRRKDIAKDFASLVTDMQSGGAGSTINDVSSAKVAARNALQAGDTAGAIREAERAAKILQDLKQAGENTYGFSGIAKELQQIANSAAQLDEANAQKGVDAAKKQVDDLVAYASALQRIQIGYEPNETSEQQTTARLQALAQAYAKYMTIPVTLTAPDSNLDEAANLIKSGGASTANPSSSSTPKFAGGGKVQGPGTTTSDSIIARLSNKEWIINAQASEYWGDDFLRAINARRFPKFATGGPVGSGPVPNIPPLAPSLMQPAQDKYLGTMDMSFPGGDSLTVSVPASQGDQLRRLRKKFGRTHS
ncbi:MULTISPECIES: phage tail tape measure protein [unclassified Pseudomonas]|uniref:phage tail tape measure protein n=1 Tax=unclassified Pseudomonas TaxID=196821 RepID=UPI001C60FE0A|nr:MULTISPECIES: phage tail tape measure protein [unclassified Pseudomonas]MBW5416109.1 phage tail tape measure protein [Pseudomonas sp. MAG002Y]